MIVGFLFLEEKSNRWSGGHTVCVVFCVFFVTPSKMKMQTSQNRRFVIWEVKEDKYTKSLAKNQVCAIIHMRDIRKFLEQFGTNLEYSLSPQTFLKCAVTCI